MNLYADNPDKGAHDSAQWARKWTTDRYIAKRRANFETVDAYLSQPWEMEAFRRENELATKLMGILRKKDGPIVK
jgi:hypothetical protein